MKIKNVFTHIFILAALVPVLVACVTPYQSSGFSGGYKQNQISENVYQVIFAGNGYTNKETVQTYWLYRAAELTIDKGYAYFEIANSLVDDINYWKDGYEAYAVAQVYYIPMADVYKPTIDKEIRMYKSPFKPQPPKSFDAKKLIAVLEPYVKGKKCGGQVCSHEKSYLEVP